MDLFEDKLLTKPARANRPPDWFSAVWLLYWLVEYHDNLYIIDQHAAHEKILYERTMASLQKREYTSQMIDPPIILSLNSSEQLKLEQYMEHFTSIGFEIEPFGGKEYAVRAVPANLFSVAKRELLMEMIDDLAEGNGSGTPDLINERVATMSCKAAVKGNHTLSFAEADKLIDELLELKNRMHYLHGRPTIISMSKIGWRRNSNGLYNPLQKGEKKVLEIPGQAAEKKALIVLIGPTAVGKTALSIQLARRIGGEIISADSMQVYRHMDIGTAKIRLEEMDGVPHHLIDILEPTEDFNVVRFQALARAAAEDIYSRGKIPIVAGGTGFYIQALLNDIDFTQIDENTQFREEMERLAAEQGAEVLHERLRAVDPESAEAIHANNVKRVIRALEYYEQTGEKISAHNEAERAKISPYHFFYYVLNTDRTVLYERIEKRIDEMMEEGLVEEVRQLQAMGCRRDSVAMQGLGYKEILAYLNGEMSLETAVNILKRDTRHFAKRQLTWFRRERDVRFLYLPEFDNDRERVLEHILQELAAEAGIMECDS